MAGRASAQGYGDPYYGDEEDYDDYVKEVLEEDDRGGDEYDNPYFDDSKVDPEEFRRQQQAQEEATKQAKEEQIARERAEKVQREREAKFEEELSRMDADKQKAARKQQRKDKRVVKAILRAAKKKQHYAVLGIRNWEICVPPKSISIAGKFEFTIPGFSLFHISQSTIRRSYRSRALAVHPDKNRDGRAVEAFVAVEESASILSDEALREKYDAELRKSRSKNRNQVKRLAGEGVTAALGTLRRFWKVFKRVLGPFAFPVLILGSLII